MIHQQVEVEKHWRVINTTTCQFLLERDYSEAHHCYYVALRYHIRVLVWVDSDEEGEDVEVIVDDPYIAKVYYDTYEESVDAFNSFTKDDCLKVRKGSLVIYN